MKIIMFWSEKLDAFSVILSRYEDIPIWKTHGSNKMVVWRAGYIKVGKNTERIIIQVYHIQNMQRPTNLIIIIDAFYRAVEIIFP